MSGWWEYITYKTAKNSKIVVMIYLLSSILKTFSGMIRYTCNNLSGEFNLTRAAAALGVTNAAVETLLEMFEDSGMIKIDERRDDVFVITFENSVELSKVVNTVKYEEFAELMKTINEYKNHFMTMDI